MPIGGGSIGRVAIGGRLDAGAPPSSTYWVNATRLRGWINMIRRNTASQSFLIGPLLNKTTGDGETSGATIQLAQDTGSFSASGGTLTHVGDGVYRYAPTAGETNGAQVHAILSKSGAIAVPLTIATTQANPQDAVGFGLTGVTVGTINAGTITASSIASNAITDAKIADGALTVAKFPAAFFTEVRTVMQAAGQTLATLLSRIVGTLAAGTHQPQTGDAFSRIGVNGAGLTALGDTRLANLDATVSSRLATSGYTAPDNAGITTLTTRLTSGRATNLDNLDATISSRAAPGDAMDLVADAVDGAALAASALTEIRAEVEAVLASVTRAELAAVPAANAPLADKIGWLFLLARNRATQTATTATVFADNGSTVVATSSTSDDGTTFTRGEYGA